jgi:hypothetical protein
VEYIWRVPSEVGLRARRAGTRDFCPSLAALKNPVQNIIFLTIHFFINLLVTIAQQPWAGSRAGSPVSG